MPKLPTSNPADAVQDYFKRLDEEVNDLRTKCEMLEHQARDREKALAVAESRAERAEHERDTARAQRDDAIQKRVEAVTVIEAVFGLVQPVHDKTLNDARSMKREAMNVLPAPRNNNGPPRSISDLSADIAKIGESFGTPKADD